MGTVLPFIRPSRSYVMTPNAPVLTPLSLAGSVQDATNPLVQIAAMDANPMRRLNRVYCHPRKGGCGHRWQAPAIGLCPQCHRDCAVLTELVPCMAQRV